MTSIEHLQNQAIDRFWETVPPLWNLIRSHIRATAAEKFGISVEQFHILRHVRGGIGSISDLATAKNISRPAVSQAVELLVGKGLLTRIQSTQDRRYVEVTLTEAGNALLEAVIQETRGWMKSRLQALSADELQTLARAMQAMQKMLA